MSLCVAVFQLYAQQEPSRIEKKSFPGVREIRFDQQYGNIAVTESDSQQVELEIRYFDRKDLKPSCDISAVGNVLEIKTAIPQKNNWGNIFNNNKGKLGIDYIIAVPKNVAMKVNLKYGNINMDDFYGDFTLNMSYGNLNVNVLHKSPVNISSKYSNIKIEQVDVLDLSCDYSNLNVNTINTLQIMSKYSNYRIDRVESVKAVCSYGGININSVVDFAAELRYTPTSIERLGKTLNLNCAYSDIKIDNTSQELETVRFDGRYSNLRLELNENVSAELNVDLRYGHLSVDDKFTTKYSFSETDHHRVIKKGTIGAKTPTAKINISNSYANVSIK
jgi:hypothetical protein